MSKRPMKHRTSQVVVAFITPDRVHARFMASLLELLDYDNTHQGYCDREAGGGYISLQTSPRVAEARSQVVDHFFASFPDATHLLWLDSDARFEPNVLERMMAVSEEAVPILGALAFGGNSPDNMYPTLYGLTRDEDGTLDLERHTRYPRDAIVKVGATGCHCVLIRREVFEAMKHAYAVLPNGKPNPYPWYAEGHIDRYGHPLGEDIIFCLKASALGYPTYVHTGIKTGHLKEISLTEEVWDSVEREHDAKVVPIRDAI